MQQSHAELNLLYQALQKIHPGLYEFITADSLQREYQKIQQNLPSSTHIYDFYVTLRKFIASIKDGHTVILPPRSFVKELIKKGKFVPFFIKFYQERIYIDQYLGADSALQKGYEILKIDSIQLDSFVQNLLPQMPADGDNVEFQRTSLESFFGFYLAEKIGFPDSICVYYKTQNQDSIASKKIALLKFSEIKKSSKYQINNKKKHPIHLEWLQDSSFALLRINSFEWYKNIPRSFNKTLEKKMKEIANHSPKALIIDLRENGGGQILLSMRLFSYFCDSLFPLVSYTQINQKQFIIQAQSNSNKRKTYKFKPFGWFNSLWIEKNQVTSRFQIRPALTYNLPAKKYCYKGKFYILCGPNTFSSAAFFCSLARQHTQAILVGEETGGGYYGTSAGTWVKLVLPHSKIIVHIPTILFRLNVSGVPFGKGVPPHIPYTPTFEDKFWGKDSILDFILQHHENLSR
ncbi:MAG: S41 family peptidase [Bacteroidia bacterium]|nr:S41 family peptidase [Bacteroidia bacterium]MDW8158749.1 S41 family peptidase [Bacteroidia bacterium]